MADDAGSSTGMRRRYTSKATKASLETVWTSGVTGRRRAGFSSRSAAFSMKKSSFRATGPGRGNAWIRQRQRRLLTVLRSHVVAHLVVNTFEVEEGGQRWRSDHRHVMWSARSPMACAHLRTRHLRSRRADQEPGPAAVDLREAQLGYRDRRPATRAVPIHRARHSSAVFAIAAAEARAHCRWLRRRLTSPLRGRCPCLAST
jgi:hypothetical protein